jgi:hypothetical protein
VSTPLSSRSKCNRIRLEVFATGNKLLPNSPSFAPRALHEGARFMVPDMINSRSVWGEAFNRTVVASSRIDNF